MLWCMRHGQVAAFQAGVYRIPACQRTMLGGFCHSLPILWFGALGSSDGKPLDILALLAARQLPGLAQGGGSPCRVCGCVKLAGAMQSIFDPMRVHFRTCGNVAKSGKESYI